MRGASAGRITGRWGGTWHMRARGTASVQRRCARVGDVEAMSSASNGVYRLDLFCGS